jgi:hypothetical protein
MEEPMNAISSSVALLSAASEASELEMLSPAEVGKIIGKSTWTVRRMIEKGIIPAYDIAGRPQTFRRDLNNLPNTLPRHSPRVAAE